MSATDHTIKLGLPLFRDDDKPTWRGDINEMSQRVDDGYGRLETDISTAANIASRALNVTDDIKQDVEGQMAEFSSQIASQIAAIPQMVEDEVSQFETSNYIDLVGSYNADPTGVTDVVPAIQRAMTEHHSTGGILYLRPGNYKWASQLSFNSDTGGVPWAIIGGGRRNYAIGVGPSDTATSTGGTRCLVDMPSTQPAVYGNYVGNVRFENFTFEQADASKSGVFIKMLRSNFDIVNMSFFGHDNNQHLGCNQDAIELGIVGQLNGIGYGGSIKNCEFNRIRRCVTYGGSINGFYTSNIVIGDLCGSSETNSAPLWLIGSGDQCSANYFCNIIAEPHAYHFLFHVEDARGNVFINPQSWDTTWHQPTIYKTMFGGKNMTYSTVVNPWLDYGNYTKFYTSLTGRRFTEFALRKNLILCNGFLGLPVVTNSDLNDPKFEQFIGYCGLGATESTGELCMYNGGGWYTYKHDSGSFDDTARRKGGDDDH